MCDIEDRLKSGMDRPSGLTVVAQWDWWGREFYRNQARYCGRLDGGVRLMGDTIVDVMDIVISYVLYCYLQYTVLCSRHYHTDKYRFYTSSRCVSLMHLKE